MAVLSPDGTIYGADGKVLHFSTQRFRKDVVEGECCFMCGRIESPDVPFNSEHIVPDWLQSMLALHSESITLANGERRRYGGHKVQCCQECNTDLGDRIEQPVSWLLKGGYAGVKEQLNGRAYQYLHPWAALIFLKMHLRDFKMAWSPDTRRQEGTIGEIYSSDELHHAQCIVRTAMHWGTMGPGSCGTSFVHQASTTKFDALFDYADNSRGCASMIRVGDLCLFNVFDDAQVVFAMIGGALSRCGALSEPQARELMTRLAYTNLQTVRRPKFWTTVMDDTPRIDAIVTEPHEVHPHIPELWGSMLYNATRNYIDEAQAEEFKMGKRTFLLRDDDSFIETYKRQEAAVKAPRGPRRGPRAATGSRTKRRKRPEGRP